MAPVTKAGLLAFASAALAVPHAHEHARLHRRGAPPVYGGSSAAPAYGGSSSVAAAGSGSASVWASGSAPAYGGSSSFVAPVSGSAIPSYGASASGWSYPAGNSSWGYATGTSGPTGYSFSGSASYSTCTETSTLIYRSTTSYSTYYVTHTITPGGGEAASSVAPASVPAGSGPAGYPSGGAGGAPAGSGAACVPDVTVTTTVRQTVTVNGGGAGGEPSGAPAGGAPSGIPAYSAGAGSSGIAIPSIPAKVHGHGHGGHSKAPPAPESSAPAYSAPSSPESSAAPPAYSSGAAPSSAPSSSPSSGGSGALGGAFGGKRGLAYNDASLCDAFSGSKYVGWAYNWGSSSSGLTSSIPFVPMLWGTSSEFTDSWMANAKSAIAGGAPFLFSFNEPDMPTQANLSPQEAATAWKQYMEPFAGQAKLVAPSVTNSPAQGQGQSWLNEFLEACSDCTIDAVNGHWYDSAGNDIKYFKQQVGALASSTGKPAFITEFGFIGSDSEISSAMESAMSYMDSNDSILGYSYFMVEDGVLVNGDSLSSIGQTYADSA